MKEKDKNNLLSRREFFKKATQKTLPFITAMAIPSFLQSCGGGGDEPVGSDCSDCSAICQSNCSSVCSDSCKENTENTGTPCSDCSAACMDNCENECTKACASNCENSATGKVDDTDISDVAVDLGLSVMWASFNVGAAAPQEYGQYAGWGDPTGKKKSTNNNDYPNSNPPNDISGTEYDMAYVQWGDGWRLPSKEEFSELKSKCNWEKDEKNGVSGVTIKGSNGNSIFIPWGGYYQYNGGKPYSKGLNENYALWTGTHWKNGTHAYGITGNTFIQDYGFYRYERLNIRPVTENNTGCRDCSSGCVAGCKNTCSSGCENGCITSCANTCGTGCSQNCIGGCTVDCGSDCTNTCMDICATNCSTVCLEGCGSNCEGGCNKTCTGGCQGECLNSCKDGCFNQCGGGCQYTCGVGCTVVAGVG